MATKIQRYPAGLLGTVGSPTSVAPSFVADQVVATLNSDPFFEYQQLIRQDVSSGSSVYAAGGGVNYVWPGTTLQGVIFVRSLALEVTTPLPGGESITLALTAQQRPGTARVLLTPFSSFTGGGGIGFLVTATFYHRPLMLRSGDSIGAWVSQRVGVTSLAGTVTAEYWNPGP